MQENQPTLVKGTRDFGAHEVFKRNYILDILRKTYQKYGFLPLETPAMEQLETLTGKYGQEGDQLLFKILNSGDFLSGVTTEQGTHKTLLPKIATKGLRYDLTVPLMRYVVMNKDLLTFPFRRYQIQPVWRADRPQKGRYREFYQCDIDVIGTDSLLCEAEILALAHEVLQQLGLRHFAIHLNHRGVLAALAAIAGVAEQTEALCIALDKLDKVGKDRVSEELQQRGFDDAALQKLSFLFDFPSTEGAQWEILTERLSGVAAGEEALKALNQILVYLKALGIGTSAILLDPTLARGLSYYTGTIFEVKVRDTAYGSIGGGGRYDGLTDVFGVPSLAGVGFSFGLDRLYAVLDELSLFPSIPSTMSQVMIIRLEQVAEEWALNVLAALRARNIAAEIYPDAVKLKRQLQYAHKRQIPFVVLIGEDEQASRTVMLKNMATGTQQSCSLEDLIKNLS